MTEPIKNVTLGGLTYNANQVENARENEDGTFTINFKTGEKLTYPKQSCLRHKPEEEQTNGEMRPIPDTNPVIKYNSGMFDEVQPSINQRVDGGFIYDDTYFDISNVMGATFTSYEDTVTHVNLNNCNDTKVDLASNYSRWYGDEVTINGGAGNEVELDANDVANINGKTIEGEGTASQKDYEE